MRKLFWLLPLLCILITGCGRTEPEDSNILRGIYAPAPAVFGTSDTMNATGIYPMEDGYACALYESNLDSITVGDTLRQKLTIVLWKDGETTEIPVELTDYGTDYAVGERGIYTFALTENGRELFHIGWDGTVLHRVDSAVFKPGSARSLEPEAACIRMEMPVRETENGLAIVWGKKCVLLDTALQEIGGIDLPGDGDTVFVEGDVLWLSYTEKGVRMLGKAVDGIITESWPMPESFSGINSYYWTNLIGCMDGWLYGWNDVEIVRWKFGAEEETIEQVMHFLHSGISGQKIAMITMLPDGTFSIQSRPDGDTRVVVQLYEKAPDKDLSEMTVLTLACVGGNTEMEEAVMQFNRNHDDAYIRIVTYEQYNTADEPTKGYTLFRADLTTGLLQADILCGESFHPIDLYPLMTGEVGKEDIAPCVRNACETDGQLLQIGSSFRLSTLVGRKDALNGMTGWNLETFLDFADGLGEGEYLMEEICQRDAMGMLFGGNMYEPFLMGNTASFDDPLYLRYLHFLASLPETGQKYMNHGKDNSAMVLAGEIGADQLQVESAGENLYWNGKIKLEQEYHLNAVHGILKLFRTFNTTDLTCIGYPREDGSGVSLSFDYTYSIPSTCKDPALAWELLENILIQGAVFPEEEDPDSKTLRWNCFSTLQDPYFAHLESLEGLQIFTGFSYGTWIGRDLVLDENGCYNGQPGTLQEIDDTVIGFIRHLYETAGGKFTVDWELSQIVMEEESRYLAGAISAEECADIVQSRVRIYLAEKE